MATIIARTSCLALALSLALVPASKLGAQSSGLREVRSKGAAGAYATFGFPVGEFQNFVDFAGGLGAFGLVNLDRQGIFGFRFDGSFLLYGVRVAGGAGRHISTTNYIGSFGLGPQLTIGNGPIRPYVFGTAGFSYFATESHAHDYYGYAGARFYDFTYTLSAGGGLQFALSNGRKPVFLDISASFVENGRTEYLRTGSIRELPGGGIVVRPIESQTNMINFRAGVSVGLF